MPTSVLGIANGDGLIQSVWIKLNCTTHNSERRLFKLNYSVELIKKG